jgi:hypothetical protein
MAALAEETIAKKTQNNHAILGECGLRKSKILLLLMQKNLLLI